MNWKSRSHTEAGCRHIADTCGRVSEGVDRGLADRCHVIHAWHGLTAQVARDTQPGGRQVTCDTQLGSSQVACDTQPGGSQVAYDTQPGGM